MEKILVDADPIFPRDAFKNVISINITLNSPPLRDATGQQI